MFSAGNAILSSLKHELTLRLQWRVPGDFKCSCDLFERIIWDFIRTDQAKCDRHQSEPAVAVRVFDEDKNLIKF